MRVLLEINDREVDIVMPSNETMDGSEYDKLEALMVDALDILKNNSSRSTS